MKKTSLGFLSYTILGGCALQPTVYDVTGFSSAAIVTRVRCETQEAIYALLIEMLRQEPDNRSHEIADLIEKDNRNIILLKNYKNLPSGQAAIFSRFDDTIIVYDFQLRMTETNIIGAASNLVRPLLNTAELIGFKASNSKERQNYQTFRITTNIKEIMKRDCKKIQSGGVNWEYPIAGQIGLKSILNDYFAIAADNYLDKITGWPNNAPSANVLKFTTTISGEINPGLTITPIEPGYYIRDVSGGFSASRKDEHQLTIGLYLPDGTKGFNFDLNPPAVANQQVDGALAGNILIGRNPLNLFEPASR